MADRDFTLTALNRMLQAFTRAGYLFFTLEQYFSGNAGAGKIVLLRHDVDKKPGNSLKTAVMENRLGIVSSYYFRVVKQSNHPDIIKKIVASGHEVGYHYEDLTLAKGDYNTALQSFKSNLDYFRSFYPVKTICMHGSPLSKWDNRGIWEKSSYKDFGIIGEPYLDVDFNRIFYLSDTGRTWHNRIGNRRDKVDTSFDIPVKSTFDIIALLQEGKLPPKIMINIHPQRWAGDWFHWLWEFCGQKIKNTVKNVMFKDNS